MTSVPPWQGGPSRLGFQSVSSAVRGAAKCPHVLLPKVQPVKTLATWAQRLHLEQLLSPGGFPWHSLLRSVLCVGSIAAPLQGSAEQLPCHSCRQLVPPCSAPASSTSPAKNENTTPHAPADPATTLMHHCQSEDTRTPLATSISEKVIANREE